MIVKRVSAPTDRDSFYITGRQAGLPDAADMRQLFLPHRCNNRCRAHGFMAHLCSQSIGLRPAVCFVKGYGPVTRRQPAQSAIFMPQTYDRWRARQVSRPCMTAITANTAKRYHGNSETETARASSPKSGGIRQLPT